MYSTYTFHAGVHASCTCLKWIQLHFPYSHRTPGTGLYDNLQKYSLPDPTAVFDTSYFARNPRPFFSLAKELYPGRYSPNLAHCFVALLQDKGVLLRNYTQNIDGLERREWARKCTCTCYTCTCTCTCNTHAPSHPSTADEAWYWPKRILCSG